MKYELNFTELIPAKDILDEELNNIKGGYSPDDNCQDGCKNGPINGAGHK